jgi:hypothetical protein
MSKKKNITKVGIDLDNTIVNYGESYIQISKSLKLEVSNPNREIIKDFFQNSPKGDYSWQEFQSILYTRGLEYAQVANGLFEFLNLCNTKKIEIYIISHKTNTTPEEFGGADLRIPAINWLNTHKITPLKIRPENIFFCETQLAKIETINHLGVDMFIDDLEEVINHTKLNKNVEGILYSRGSKLNSINSFHDLIERLTNQ